MAHMLTIRMLPAVVGLLCLLGAFDALASRNWAQELICVVVFIPCAVFMLRNAKRMLEDINRGSDRDDPEARFRKVTVRNLPSDQRCVDCGSPAKSVKDTLGTLTRAVYLGSKCPSCGNRFCLKCAGKRNFVCSCGTQVVDA
jgi:hypothetical protein